MNPDILHALASQRGQELRAAAEQARLRAAARAAWPHSPPAGRLAAARHRFGAALIRAGRRLQGLPAPAPLGAEATGVQPAGLGLAP